MDLGEVTLIREDFSDLAVGLASTYPLTAEGEYHVVDRKMGRWTGSTIHGSWNAARSGSWKVLEEGGRHVMAHTEVLSVGPPMLTAGGHTLGDYAFVAQIRPLSFEGACGLVVRYQNARCYDAVRITRGMIALLHHDNGAERWLASRGHAFDVDRYYEVRVECVGSQIKKFAP